MRDAFGGIFMIRLLLVFVFIYVAFAAVSLNYAKAFRIKNSIISLIEENEIIDLKKLNSNEKLNSILEDANYSKTCNHGNGVIKSVEEKEIGYCYNGIVVLVDSIENVEGTASKAINYQVITYADWNLGALNKILALAGKKENSDEYVTGTWTIKGSAKVIARG